MTSLSDHPGKRNKTHVKSIRCNGLLFVALSLSGFAGCANVSAPRPAASAPELVASDVPVAMCIRTAGSMPIRSIT